MNRLVIIDGNAIVHRAYHALPPLTTKDGLMVNAAYGFASMLLKAWRDLKPTHIAVTFDLAGPTFRHVKFEKYKATRVKADQALYDQLPLAHDIARAFNIPIYEKQGYEADDAIGTIADKVKIDETIIVTGDKDTLQLVNKKTKVLSLRKGMSDTVLYDEAEVKNVFGFPPSLMVDYKALRGDASDNIPGVPGIGEKTATELIQKFGGIDEIYKIVNSKQTAVNSEIKESVAKKLKEGAESAKMSYELATIDRQVPDLDFKLDDCAVKDFDRQKVVELFQKLEFTSLLKRLPGGEEPTSGTKQKVQKKIKKESFVFEEISGAEAADKVFSLIKKEKSFAVEAAFDGSDVFNGKFSGLVAVIGDKGFFIKGAPPAEWFSDETIELVGHDLKRLVKILKIHANLEVKNDLFDLMLGSYILNPGSRAHDRAGIVLRLLGREFGASGGRDSLFGFNARAAADELYLLSLTKEKIKKELEAANNFDLFKKVEIPLLKILAEMELNGIAIDLKKLKELSIRLATELKKGTEKIYKMAGTEFNIGSPAQLREVLFEKMDIPVLGIKKGKTGLSTAAAELEKMRGLHPIIDEIENWRELSKLANTYVDVLPGLVNKKTGRLHTTFNQAVTATGRLSSSDPNLQNIPIRGELGKEIRDAFVAEKGNILLGADYSQIELRIVASLAEDKKMIEIFQKGEDIHRATAAAINGIPLEKVTKEMRQAAKEVNFGVLYGMGAYGLSWRADISRFEAKNFIEKYFSEFSGVKKYLEATIAFARESGYCETLFGRRRYIPELKASNLQLRAAAERMAINHPVQGTAADLMKMAMIEIESRIKNQESRKGGDRTVRMLLQVHDELVFEVKEGLEKEAGALIKEAMEKVITLRVPIIAEVSFGKSWGETK